MYGNYGLEYDDASCVGSCKKLDFIVNFTEIGWERWIVYPATYNAYYCSGQCPIPLTLQTVNDDDNSLQITNHAQMMSVL